MYKRVKKAKLGRTESHRKSLINNLLRSLLKSNHVVTTTPKAKVLKERASSLILNAVSKKQNLEFIRKVHTILGNDDLVKKLFEYSGKEKVGVGIVKVGFRAGDNSEKSRVYLLGMEKKKKTITKDEEKKEDKKVEESNKTEKKSFNAGREKRVDKTAVITRTERAKTRSGL